MVAQTCSVPFLPDPTDMLDCRFQEKGHRDDNRAGDEVQTEMPEPVSQHHLARADQEKDDPRQPPSPYPLRSAGSEHGVTVIATAAACQDANSVRRNPLMTARCRRRHQVAAKRTSRICAARLARFAVVETGLAESPGCGRPVPENSCLAWTGATCADGGSDDARTGRWAGRAGWPIRAGLRRSMRWWRQIRVFGGALNRPPVI